MSTRRDYKPGSKPRPSKTRGQARRRPARHKKTSRKPLPKLRILAAMLILGVFAGFLTYLWQLPGPADGMRATTAPVARTPAAASQPQEPSRAREPLPQEQPPAVEEDPEYQFFALLPRKEVVIPESELQPDPETFSGTWTLQVGSFRRYDEADRLKAILAFQGVESSIDQRGDWFRVRVGPFQSRREMDRIRSRLARNDIRSMVIRNN